MAAAEHWMDIIANNLANVNTSGFKQDGMAFDDLLRRQMFGEGGSGPLVGVLGSGAAPYEQFTDLSQGSLQTTSNPLDVALSKNNENAPVSMFAIQTDSGVSYTRNGSFSLADNPADNTKLALVTKNGQPVLDENRRPILLSKGAIAIDREGGITVDGTDAGVRLGVFSGTFTKAATGSQQFDSTDAQPATTGFSVIEGALESSNVNTIESMVAMIALQRSYELAQKSIQSQDDQTGKLIGSLS